MSLQNAYAVLLTPTVVLSKGLFLFLRFLLDVAADEEEIPLRYLNNLWGRKENVAWSVPTLAPKCFHGSEVVHITRVL